MAHSLRFSDPRFTVEFWLKSFLLSGLIALLSPVWVRASCLDRIPPEILPIFLEVTSHVPHWRNAICSQVWAESGFDPNAASYYFIRGEPCCIGLGQIARPTWSDVSPAVSCVGVSRTDPRCNLRVMVEYMRRLLGSYKCGRNAEEPWEISRACYNAGPGNINKERRVCKLKYGCQESLWFGNREEVCRRRPSACKETRTYVKRIKKYMEE